MKLTINRDRLIENPEQFLRHAGYGIIFDSRRGISSFVKRLGNNFYPRLHLYYEEVGDKIIFNLHLDQKQASYEGADHMHNAEYDNEIVRREVENLKNIIGADSSSNNHQSSNSSTPINNISSTLKASNLKGSWQTDLKNLPKSEKSWWQKLFS